MSLHPSLSVSLLLKIENTDKICSSSLPHWRVSLIKIPNMSSKACNVLWHVVLNHLQLWVCVGLSGLWVIEEPLGTSAEKVCMFCFTSADWAWQRGWVTPAKEVPLVPTKVKAEKQSSVKGKVLRLGKVRGSGKRNSSFPEQKIGFYFLRLLLELKIQCLESSTWNKRSSFLTTQKWDCLWGSNSRPCHWLQGIHGSPSKHV